jgi:hypothetical protein
MLHIKPKADLIYGASKTRKTSNIGLVALYIYERYHKRTRLVTLDGGGYDPIISLVNEGIVVPWFPIARPKFTISTIDLACQGWWPKDPDDPASPLVAHTAETWEDIGCVAFEGLTSMGDSFLRQLKADKAHLSQDPSYTYAEQGVDVEDATGKKGSRVISYSGGNMSYYGSVQDQLYDFVIKSHQLPCEKVIWTALEGKGEEEGSRAPTYGPSIAGKKSIGKAPQWFGNCVHIEQLVERVPNAQTKQIDVVERPVMYLRTHADPLTNIPFPCGTRAPFQFASELPAYLDPPDMAELYRKLDAMTEKMDAVIHDKKQRATQIRGFSETDKLAEVAAVHVTPPAPRPEPLQAAEIVSAVNPYDIQPGTVPAAPVPAATVPQPGKVMFQPPKISVRRPQ